MKNKMLKAILAACLLLAGYSQAQVADTTNTPSGPSAPFLSGPGSTVLQFLTTGSNFLVAPYAIFAKNNGKNELGGGIGAFYKISDYVEAGLRLDYVNKRIWMPSGNFQLQLPLTILGKVTVVPFTFGGIATPLSGKGPDNGSPVGILGIGAAVRLSFLGSGKFWQNSDILADVEKWSGGGFNASDNQIRIGFGYKF